MLPEICKIGPFTVYAYGFMLVIAFAVSAALSMRQAKKEGLDTDTFFNLLFITFVSGILGARLFYVIENLDYYLKSPSEMIMLQHGGLSWFGGLILGGFIGINFLKRKKMAVFKILDLIAPFIALGQAIGRIGCFLNGCCYGRTTFPTQLYSSLFLFCIFFILKLLQDKPHRDGQIFYMYLLLYAIKRFFIEFFRLDNKIIFFGLTLFQIISVIIFCLAIAKLTLPRKNKFQK